MLDQSPFGRINFQGIAIYLPIFFLLLMIGIVGGRTVGMLAFSNKIGEKSLIQSRAPGNGQRNLLIIMVDQLPAPRPSLDGIWLLITFPDSATLTVVPIYPDPMNSAASQSLYADIFPLTPDLNPNPQLLERLSEGVLWDYYLVIDRQGSAAVMDILASAAEMQPADPGWMAAAGSSPDLSFAVQLQGWESACELLPYITNSMTNKQLLDAVASHLLTNFRWEQLPLNLRSETNAGAGYTCNFPTISP